jgi:hypothetical protein
VGDCGWEFVVLRAMVTGEEGGVSKLWECEWQLTDLEREFVLGIPKALGLERTG